MDSWRLAKDLDETKKKNPAQNEQTFLIRSGESELPRPPLRLHADCSFLLRFSDWTSTALTPWPPCYGCIVKTRAPRCKVPPAMWPSTISTMFWKAGLATKAGRSTVNKLNVVVIRLAKEKHPAVPSRKKKKERKKMNKWCSELLLFVALLSSNLSFKHMLHLHAYPLVALGSHAVLRMPSALTYVSQGMYFFTVLSQLCVFFPPFLSLLFNLPVLSWRPLVPAGV